MAIQADRVHFLNTKETLRPLRLEAAGGGLHRQLAANVVVHGHAHHGKMDGRTPGGVAVHNVAISRLQAQQPSAVYRIFEM